MQIPLSSIDRKILLLLQHNADLSAAEIADKVELSQSPGYPEVLECHTMAGESDYLLKVVAKDIDSYERFLRDQLLQRPHVQEAHSHIAMSEVKRTTELPLD